MIFSGSSRLPLLGVNIDHVATLRNARGGTFPDPVRAAMLAVEAGADIITFHLREDRRHIRDDDVVRLKESMHVPLNFEAAVTEEMLTIMEQTRPEHVCLVPERRLEVTTEGGLDVASNVSRLREACGRLAAVGSRVSLFIDPEPHQIDACAQAGAPCVELHTGAYAQQWWAHDETGQHREIQRLSRSIQYARSLGLEVHAGHGLAVWGWGEVPHGPSSVEVLASFTDVCELHIGHALMGHAVFVGLTQAMADFKQAMQRGRTMRSSMSGA